MLVGYDQLWSLVVKVKLWMRKDKDGNQAPTFSPELFGQNEVSVFRGFCNKHDTALFRNLDAGALEPTVDDCMKLIYRSVTRESDALHHAVATLLGYRYGNDPEAFKKSGLSANRIHDGLARIQVRD